MITPVTQVVSDPTPGDWLDRLLVDDARDARDAHVDDAGFTARVMSALPASLLAPRWRRPVEWALWGIAGTAIAATLPSMATDVAREMFRLIAAQPISPAHVLAVLAAMGAATFGGAAFVLRRD